MACAPAAEDTPEPSAATQVAWHTLGTWSGDGDRQTESFDITTGGMRLAWEARAGGDSTPGRLRVALHSAISGRPLRTLVEADGPGADSVGLTASPRVAYLLIESEGLEWHLALQEAALVDGEAGRARE